MPTTSNPSLVELVCGVHFQPLGALLSPHYGLLWETFREHGYERLQEAPPLPPLPRELAQGESPVLPHPRIWYVTEDDQRLIQMQRDRLLFNWRKTQAASAPFPGFDAVYSEFAAHLRRLQTFLRAFGLGEVRPLEFEISAVNHIVSGDTWSSLDEVGRVFSDYTWSGPEPAEINWRTTLPLTRITGAIGTVVRSARRNPDNAPLFLFELTARGIHPGEDLFASVDHWFSAAHAELSETFDRMIADEVRASWGT